MIFLQKTFIPALSFPVALLAVYIHCYKFEIFQNLYWADSGDLVAIASDTSFYILKYNVRISIKMVLFRFISFRRSIAIFKGLDVWHGLACFIILNSIFAL